ncbi:hypothetical protein [Brevundimonas sp.]|uniref:hypothetical protein n=1 Tax=Brevundimonas sp. TaxID=1871086 RepID=UPI0028A818ED|nr:hypothetical protein [Brevundimonas sp.]
MELHHEPPFTKKRCGKLAIWRNELELAHDFAMREGLTFELSATAYQVAKIIGPDVRIVIYPHRTKSTGNVSLRVRDENSKNPDRADDLMVAMDGLVPGFNTFSRHLSDAGIKRQRAAHQREAVRA